MVDSRLRASALYWSSLSRADVRRWREEEEGICDVICDNLSACSGHHNCGIQMKYQDTSFYR